MHTIFGILAFDNINQTKHIKHLINPRSFKDPKALCSFKIEVLDIRGNDTAQVFVEPKYLN